MQGGDQASDRRVEPLDVAVRAGEERPTPGRPLARFTQRELSQPLSECSSEMLAQERASREKLALGSGRVRAGAMPCDETMRIAVIPASTATEPLVPKVPHHSCNLSLRQ